MVIVVTVVTVESVIPIDVVVLVVVDVIIEVGVFVDVVIVVVVVVVFKDCLLICINLLPAPTSYQLLDERLQVAFFISDKVNFLNLPFTLISLLLQRPFSAFFYFFLLPCGSLAQ